MHVNDNSASIRFFADDDFQAFSLTRRIIMASKTLVLFLYVAAVTGFLYHSADELNQGPVKPPPTLKVPKGSDLPPSNIRKRFDRSKNTTYVDIDVPLPQQSRSGAVTSEEHITVGEIGLSFRLEYKGSSASELSAAYLTINFVGDGNWDESPTSATEVEVRADAYQYAYQSTGHNTEQTTDAENAARPTSLKKESVTVELPLGDLQQVAYSYQVVIRIGKKELRVRSIQLADLRKTLIAQNAN